MACNQFATIGHSELKLYTLDASSPPGVTITPQPNMNHTLFRGITLSSVVWNHTNQVLAVAGNRPAISLVQANNGTLLSTIPFNADQSFNGNVTALAFSPTSRYLASACGKFVHLWDLKRRNMKSYFGEAAGAVSCLAIAAEGDVVAGDETGAVRIWDAKQQCNVLQTQGSLGAVASTTCLQLSCLGPSRIASGYSDGILALWDYSTQAQVRNQAVHPNSALTGLAFSPKNGRLLATVGADGRVALIDCGSKSTAPPSATIEAGDALTTISFHEDAIHCAVGTKSGYTLIYDWRNVKKPVAKVDVHMPYAVAAIAFQVPRPAPSPAASIDTPGKTKITAISTAAAAAAAAAAATTAVATAAATAVATAAAPAMSSSANKTSVPAKKDELLAGPHPTASPGRRAATSTSSSLPLPPSFPVPARIEPHASLSTLSVGSSLEAFHAPPLLVPPSPSRETRKDKLRDSGEGLLRSLSPIQSVPGGSSVSGITIPLESNLDHVEDNKSSGQSTKPAAPPAVSKAAAPTAPTQSSAPAPIPAPTPTSSVKQNATGSATTGKPIITSSSSVVSPEMDSLRRAMQPVTNQELQDALHLLRYDMHKEIQAITREQVRQFSLAKDDTERLLRDLSEQLADLLAANKELRAENERLRRIY